jgi:hypothetical protein
MIYLLKFLALIGIAAALAASPFLIDLFESLAPADMYRRRSAAGHGLARAASKERSEMRAEIRRATDVLKSDRRHTGR